MARQVESTHAQLENLTYQLSTMSKKVRRAVRQAVRQSVRTPALCLYCHPRPGRTLPHPSSPRPPAAHVPQQANEALGGSIALLKAQTTKVFEYCAREAAQIFGGASYVRGGQGEKVERLYREVRGLRPGCARALCAAFVPLCPAMRGACCGLRRASCAGSGCAAARLRASPRLGACRCARTPSRVGRRRSCSTWRCGRR